ncbi:pyruvate:ferredoxin (flavodoxin) oxidoreductase [bacterium]|nr:pyruvate:ferredoxin (flavodoxin) oxidoreductase [bacterium]MBU1985364.1 pyruvate:ferredoxin (flavodoxin) oxidoreductase [bacterium]
MSETILTIDGNEAAANTAHRISEVCAIYPITPSSNMGEWADEWSAMGRRNIWGTVPTVIEMQSEGGASAAVHGALQTGSLTTTFTASQGLLLMIPSMFKIAGELTSAVFHVSARTVATHALSIFGDHSDIMAVRSTGFGLLGSANVQEVHDNACIAMAASLKSRVPFIHFFDGFRTSHEVQKLYELSDDDLRHMMDDELILAHRARALSPDRPVIRGTAQNPDVFFQAREACNPFYLACPDIVQEAMDKFAARVGRHYHLFDYVGAPDAERVVILMGSGCDPVHETVDYLCERGEKVGVVKVRLYRPFSVKHFLAALPKSVKSVAVLDRTKEPGATGDPLYLDVITALSETVTAGNGKFTALPRIVGGRYGLSSKEFTPAMIKAVFDELKKPSPRNHFTVGILDDVTNSSLEYDPNFSVEPDDVFRGKFYGLGADGTVGANKNSIKIIGDETNFNAQGYFVYDSKKSGAITVSHLRFGKKPIRSTYLINRSKFVACHQQVFLEKLDMLSDAVEGAVFLLNSQAPTDKVWDTLPREVQQDLISRKMKFYCIDAYKVAEATGMGLRINTIMQTCFFAISGILPRDEAIAAIKRTIEKTYGKKGEDVVKQNYEAVDKTLANLHEVKIPGKVTSTFSRPPVVPADAPEFMKKTLAKIIEGHGDDLPVSAFPVDGTFPLNTCRYEKRNIALEIPVWDAETCIQCNKCVIVCPHASIRAKVFTAADVKNAPKTFLYTKFRGRDFDRDDLFYSLQVAPEDCTGCALCVSACPAKNKAEVRLRAINMAPQPPLREKERDNWTFFLTIPEVDRSTVKVNSVKGSQFLEPLFEFSGACGGCGETPYVKLLTQLFGDRLLIGNATGCSSIYGGNLPTTPYSTNLDGRGPTWNNSLFEDTAEFSMGFRVTLDKQCEFAFELLQKLKDKVGIGLVKEILEADQSTEGGIAAQRARVEQVRGKLKGEKSGDGRRLLGVIDSVVRKSVWGVGGDGWAYDIGYGGLDHVLASGKNVNLLVLDTGVYSNTGGQCSKATPLGAVAKFAFGGKPVPRKDLGMMAINYGHVYTAQISMGYNDLQTVKAFLEAESYDGPSLIIAYSHCIAHGIDMSRGLDNQRMVVECGAWPLYRYDPRRAVQGLNPLQLDSKPPKIKVSDWAYSETRFKMLTKMLPDAAKHLMALAQEDTTARWRLYEQLAALDYGKNGKQEGK